MNNLQTIRSIATGGKKEQAEVAKNILDPVLDGESNPMEVDVLLKSLENIIKKVRQDPAFREVLSDELDKYPGKTFSYNAAVYQRTQKGAYQYSEDDKWNEIAEAKKQREVLLKAIPDEGILDGETGEIIHKPSKRTTDVTSITFL